MRQPGLRTALLAACLALPQLASGQSVGSTVTSSATVALPPVGGGGVRNLSFGTLEIGGTADTGPGGESAASTAKWEFTGLPKNSAVTLSFAYPTLQKGGVTLPVVWSNAGYGAWCARVAPATVETCGTAGTNTGTFNPQSPAPASTTNTTNTGNNDRLLTIWVGSRMDAVPASAPAGLYSGTVTLTISY